MMLERFTIKHDNNISRRSHSVISNEQLITHANALERWHKSRLPRFLTSLGISPFLNRDLLGTHNARFLFRTNGHNKRNNRNDHTRDGNPITHVQSFLLCSEPIPQVCNRRGHRS